MESMLFLCEKSYFVWCTNLYIPQTKKTLSAGMAISGLFDIYKDYMNNSNKIYRDNAGCPGTVQNIS